MTTQLSGIGLLLALALSGCGRSEAERAYLLDCGETFRQEICQCSYDHLKEQYGGTKLDFMLNIQSLPPEEAQAMRESIKSCKQAYIAQGFNEEQTVSQR